jgi:hypothetical protein
MPNNDAAQAKRELRLQIARQRRRIDRQVRSVQLAGVRLVSWQTYLERFSGLTLTTLAAGVASLASLGREGSLRVFRSRRLRRLLGLIWRRLLRLVFGRKAEPSPGGNAAGPSPAGGDDHGA